MSRVRYSINLEEDFELYGIDPNEDLDDWSFLDAKPEPIPEKTEDEKELFEQLLKPTIEADSIDKEIHERLKNLINETSQLIDENQNDPIIKEAKADKVEEQLPDTPENLDEERKRLSTPEYVQANRVKNIVKSLLNTTEKAEDISQFIEDITKSDRIDPNTIEIPEDHVSVPAVRLLPQIKITQADIPEEKEEENTKKSDSSKPSSRISNEKPLIPTTKQEEPQKKSFFGRYVKKLSEPKSVLKSLDETDRLSNKFQEERKKREEEAAKEAERKQKELEEQSKQFFATLQKEQERREKMPQQISQFQKQIADKLAEIVPQKKPIVVVDLITEKLKLTKTKTHESKTFMSNVNKSFQNKVKEALKQKLQIKKSKSLIRLTLFIKLMLEIAKLKRVNMVKQALKLHKWNRKIDIRMKNKLAEQKQKEEEERRKKKEKEDKMKLEKAKKAYAALKLQFYVRKYLAVKAKEQMIKEEALRKKKEEEMRKRRLMQERLPDVADIDTSWINKYEGVSDSDFDEFLDGLADPQQSSQFEEKVTSLQKVTEDIVLDAGTVPVSSDFDVEKLGVQKSIIGEPQDETAQMAKVRAEIEKRLKQKRQEAARQSTNSTSSSASSKRQAPSSPQQTNNNNPAPETPPQPTEDGGDNHQLAPETVALMRRAAQHRKHNGSGSSGRSGQISATRQSGGTSWAPRAAIMRQNNTRAQRLKKLSKVWFEGHRREDENAGNAQ